MAPSYLSGQGIRIRVGHGYGSDCQVDAAFAPVQPKGQLPRVGGEDHPAVGGRLRLLLQVHGVPRGVRRHQTW